jgi:hypothetical protein
MCLEQPVVDQERPVGCGGVPGAVPEDGHQDLDELPVRLGVQPGRDPGRRRHFLPLAGETTEYGTYIYRDEIGCVYLPTQLKRALQLCK